MIDKMRDLAAALAQIPDTRVELNPFPSGAAMLDVWRSGRLFVMEYSPSRRFGVDEVKDGEGFLIGSRYTYPDFEPAAKRLKSLVDGAVPEPATRDSGTLAERPTDPNWVTWLKVPRIAAAVLLAFFLVAAAYAWRERNEREQAQNERNQAQTKKKVALTAREKTLEIMYTDRRQRAEEEAALLSGLQAALEKGKIDTARMTIKKQLEKLKQLTSDDPVFPGDRSTFSGDVTFKDTDEIPEVTVGQQFKKIWRIKNAGKIPWKNRFLQREGEAASQGQLKSPKRVPIPDTDPDKEVNIAVDLEAPDTPGICYAEWKITDAEGKYLFPNRRPLSVTVNVLKGKE